MKGRTAESAAANPLLSPLVSGGKEGIPADPTLLLKEFAKTIHYMAYRLSFRLSPALDINDLIHAGVMGLLDAAKKYDVSRGVRFRTYAEFRVRGAMLDEIRAMDWVPRAVHEKASMLQNVERDLSGQLGRAATDDEIMQALHIGPDAYSRLLDEVKPVAIMSSADFGVRDEQGWIGVGLVANMQGSNPFLSLIAQELQARVVAAIDTLPQKERQVIALYYHEEMTLKEIGLAMGLTESRVCQIHTQAILRLKGQLKGVWTETEEPARTQSSNGACG